MRTRINPKSKFLAVIIASVLSAVCLHAAPYPPDGLAIKWTQPDGKLLKLRVFGDEFQAQTKTEDGYTVVYNAANRAYEYASLSNDGSNLIPNGQRVNGKAPAGLAKHLKLSPEAAKVIWEANHEKFHPNQRADWAKRVKAARQRRGLDAAEPAPNPAGGGGGEVQAAPAGLAPITGSYVGLTILVQFPDDQATGAVDPTNFPTTQSKIDRYCNQIGYADDGNSGSVRDYFRAQSINRADYTQAVTAVVTLPQPRNYYNWADYPANTSIRWPGDAGRFMVNDAIASLINQGFDFSSLTRDGSDRVITNLLFAGANSGVWGQGLWPHSYSLSPSVNVGTVANPMYISKYQITNAETADLPIGVFCHENGHLLLGYPDIYDSGGGSYGAGTHCIMAHGTYNNNGGKTPAPINGYFKDISGWSNVEDITASQFFTAALSTTNNGGYRIRKPGTTTEYFLIENRGDGDPWAQYSADKGILIWHIDETVEGDQYEQMTSSQHFQVSVEQADGAFDLELNRNGGDSTDFYDNTTLGFTDSTLPNAQWWDGSNSGIQIAFLSAPGASMNVRFGAPGSSSETVWVDDAAPAGAALSGTWNWITTGPIPHSGTQAHRENAASGTHQHYFDGATATLSVAAGAQLFCHVYLDPASPPSEVMLQWNDGSWEHRAYWGANSINWGTDGTNSRRYMGALPPTGQWVRLEVPASQVGLEGATLNGMAFTLYDGSAVFDRAGVTTAASGNNQPGLWYGTVAGNINTSAPNPNSSVTVSLSETEDGIAGDTTEIYTGQIHDADGHIAFTEDIDDSTRLYIDGTLVLTSDNWSDRVSTGDLNLTPGWHDFELRISNGGGGSGPHSTPGFGYDPNGGTSWVHPSDPGDGSLFRITVTGLPLPWVAADIGTGMLAGSTTHNAGTFTQAGSGTVSSTSDKLRFTYQTLTGDGEIIAKISVLQNTGTSSRVGVMIRDTPAANSKQIFMGMTGTNAYRWVRRTTTGGNTTSSNSSTGTVPNTWVRLVRSGTTITAYKSTNGTTWTTVGSTTNTTFASTCYIGLAVASGSTTTLNTSQFSNLSVTP